MDFESTPGLNTLLEILCSQDKYFCFYNNDELRPFPCRLWRCRNIKHDSITTVAEAIYEERIKLNLEKDYNNRQTRINSIKSSYRRWENSTEPNFIISMNNLTVLRNLLECDYDFLLGDSDTRLRETGAYFRTIGLTFTALDKLLLLEKPIQESDEDLITPNFYAKVLQALDYLIQDEDLMAYLSYYVTQYHPEIDNSIGIQTRSIKTKYMTPSIVSEHFSLSSNEVENVMLLTISNKLCNLRSFIMKQEQVKPQYSSRTSCDICNAEDLLGTRLRKWRNSQKLTIDDVCNLIIEYKLCHKQISVKEYEECGDLIYEATYRTYQNWEAKNDKNKEYQFYIYDLKMLKCIMNCDYEYLFGEINSLQKSGPEVKTLGLQPNTIKQLQKYSINTDQKQDETILNFSSHILDAISLIIENDSLLSKLTLFLTDITVYINYGLSDILKPTECGGTTLQKDQEAYLDYLFNEETDLERRNIFLQSILSELKVIREKFWADFMMRVYHKATQLKES